MTLRKVPGALALGLLASLAAHAALFGDGHAMGGAFHAALLQAAVVAATGLLLGLSALAWSEGRLTADGSVIASRLRDRLPTTWGVIASAAAWYAVAEAIEPQHAAVSPLFAAIALAACGWLFLRLALAFVRVVGAAVFAIRRSSFSPRLPIRKRRPQLPPLSRRPVFARRRFARPPPIAAAARA